ncbi:hypothetical protein LT85_1787 [Collimonas arenae]|uniref:Uncharacterized protein n=1 Tax=Collimonas arenae TaxID=279058 RepID=A0A0A1FAZ9_9BURK|nr:hypothetical protein LT85_1787 [Collimonas arenae]
MRVPAKPNFAIECRTWKPARRTQARLSKRLLRTQMARRSDEDSTSSTARRVLQGFQTTLSSACGTARACKPGGALQGQQRQVNFATASKCV